MDKKVILFNTDYEYPDDVVEKVENILNEAFHNEEQGTYLITIERVEVN